MDPSRDARSVDHQREVAIESVLGRFLQQQARGEDVSFDRLAESHAELMPELAERYRDLQAFHQARTGSATVVERRSGSAAASSVPAADVVRPPSGRGRRLLTVSWVLMLIAAGAAIWQWQWGRARQARIAELQRELRESQQAEAGRDREVARQRKLYQDLIEQITPIYGRQFAGAPYQGLRWDEDRPQVDVGGTWYELLAVDGLPSRRLVDYCRQTYGTSWRRRFALDLPVVLLGLGQPARSTVSLELRELGGEQIERREGIRMLAEHRRAIRDAGTGAMERVAPFDMLAVTGDRFLVRVEGVDCELTSINGTPAAAVIQFARRGFGMWWLKVLAEDLPQVLQELEVDRGSWVTLRGRRPGTKDVIELDRVPMTRAKWEQLALTRPLDRGEALDALDGLTGALRSRHAYFELGSSNYLPALDAAKAHLAPIVDRVDFVASLSRQVALAGDAHTRLRRPRLEPLSVRFAPFLVGEHEQRLLAFAEDRSGFLDDRHPYLKTIDGLPVTDWLNAARQLGVGGSPQRIRLTARRNLRYLPLLRHQMGLEPSDDVGLVLESADGASRTEMRVALIEHKPIFGAWPRTESRLLDGDIGYLRIAGMDSDGDFLRAVARRLAAFRETQGMVIDVRGNGGGTRDVLRLLLPHFVPPGELPRVVNVAKYRLREGQLPDKAEGYLASRYLFPLASTVWSRTERQAIQTFQQSFQPQWEPAAGKYSDWHYMVVSPSSAADEDWYDRPVVVLMDTACASATDVFLSAMKECPRVTLLGTASAGMSGYVRNVEIAPGFEVAISTMCSMQSNGQLYHQGIAPDEVVEPVPTDWIGATDSLLEAAVDHIRGRGN